MIDQSWLAAASTDQECLDLTAELVRYRSYPGEEGPVQRHVAAWLEAAGLAPELQATEGDRPHGFPPQRDASEEMPPVYGRYFLRRTALSAGRPPSVASGQVLITTEPGGATA